MGLSENIKTALFRSINEDDLDSTQRDHINKLSKDISTAIQDFLTEQTFTITKMKAILEIEELTTATPLQADVLSSVTTMVNGGMTGAPGPVVGATGQVNQGQKGVLIPKLNLKRFGGQGGVMMTKGFAYIGNNPVDPGQTNETLTKVKLLKQNITKG